jgi:hypothetical protein
LIATDLSSWFGRSFEVFKRSWWRMSQIWLLFCAVALVAFAGAFAFPFLLGGARLNSQGPSGTGADITYRPGDPLFAVWIALLVVAGLLAVLGLCWAQAASTYAVITDAAGRRAPFGETMRFGIRRAAPLGGWWLLATVAFVVGFVLLVVPAFYLGVVLGASLSYVVVVERAGARRCFDLIRNRWWATAGRLLLSSLLINVVQFALQIVWFVVLIPLMFLMQAGDSMVIVAIVLGSVISLVLIAVTIGLSAAATTAMGLITYTELRGRETPGITTAQLAQEIGAAPATA